MTKRLWMTAVALTALAPADAWAGLVLTYDFTGEPGTQPSTAASFQAPGIASDPITRGPGLTPEDGDESINSRSFTTAATPDLASDYYEFILGPAGSQPLDLSGLEFTARRSGAGPLAFQVRADSDSDFSDSTVLILQLLADTTDNFRVTVDLTGFSILQDLMAPVNFRIYAYAAENGSVGTFRIGTDESSRNSGLPSNLQVFGEVGAQAIPEPASLATAGLGVLMGLGYAWRRKRAAA